MRLLKRSEYRLNLLTHRLTRYEASREGMLKIPIAERGPKYAMHLRQLGARIAGTKKAIAQTEKFRAKILGVQQRMAERRAFKQARRASRPRGTARVTTVASRRRWR